MSWWLIVLICFAGYFLLCLLLVPLFVYERLDYHRQFICESDRGVCKTNQHKSVSDIQLKSRQRKCSARWVQKRSAVLPLMLPWVLPKVFAFSIVNRLEDKDKKIRELERQKKRAEAEKKASEEKQRNLLAEFDIVMTKVEEEARKGLTT